METLPKFSLALISSWFQIDYYYPFLYRVPQKELYDGIPNATIWRVLWKR
jgi:hypothetical protein